MRGVGKRVLDRLTFEGDAAAIEADCEEAWKRYRAEMQERKAKKKESRDKPKKRERFCWLCCEQTTTDMIWIGVGFGDKYEPGFVVADYLICEHCVDEMTKLVAEKRALDPERAAAAAEV